MKIATGLAIGSKAGPELAAEAVLSAMRKAELATPACVLLFLSSEFALNPESAIKAAAKAASCTNIIGCSAIGIFTEEDWVMDSPAAAAMVFSDNIWQKPDSSKAYSQEDYLLTLAAPNAINSSWLCAPAVRFGGVSGDAIGHGAFSVWENAKGVTQGYCELLLNQMPCAVGATHGLKLLTSPRRVTAANQLDVATIANLSAYTTLQSAWAKHTKDNTPIAFHQIMAVHASRAAQIERGDYALSSVISGDESTGAMTLAQPLAVGDWVSWAVRDRDAAQVDLVKTATQLKQQLPTKPEFAMLFSNLGRGPYLYDGIDQDLALMKTLFPALPLIGFYGNGEIAPINGANTLLQYSAVIALFAQQ